MYLIYSEEPYSYEQLICSFIYHKGQEIYLHAIKKYFVLYSGEKTFKTSWRFKVWVFLKYGHNMTNSQCAISSTEGERRNYFTVSRLIPSDIGK